MRKRPAESRVTDGIVEPKRRKKDSVSAKEYEKLRKIAYGGDSTLKDVVKADGNADYDPWAVQEVVKQPEFSFLDKETKKFKKVEPRTLKRAPISMAKNGKDIPAVPKPEAGKSYNPTFDDWNAVLEREGSKAVQAEQNRLAEERRDVENQARIEKAQAEEERANESAWESEWESEWEGILSEGEPSEDVLKKKRPERKTKAERNKIMRRKEEERKQVWEIKQRKREAQVAQAKALLQAVREKEMAIAKKMNVESDADDSTDGEQPQLRRRKIGPSRANIPEAPLEVVLADELQDSLRRLKPEGNLLTDRFRTMILRGKVETRAKNWQWKKPGKKVTEKWSYKDWKLHK
jgi:nucleolar protein 53